MLTCVTVLKLTFEVVFHIPTEFHIKALTVLLISYNHCTLLFICFAPLVSLLIPICAPPMDLLSCILNLLLATDQW